MFGRLHVCTFGFSNVSTFGRLGVLMFGRLDVWAFECLGVRMLGRSNVWTLECLGVWDACMLNLKGTVACWLGVSLHNIEDSSSASYKYVDVSPHSC